MPEVKNTDTKKKALFVAEAAQDHKALNLRVLDVSLQSGFADYFIIMSATSTKHAQSLADAIATEMRVSPSAIEGYKNGEWVLVDLGDVVVHIFYEPVRSYYCLDKLWAHAPTVDVAVLTTQRNRRKASFASLRT